MDLTTQMTWSLYMLRTARGALYTGITTDVPRRLEEHRSGRGAKALRGAAPLELVLQIPLEDRVSALRAEARIKRLSKQAKEHLVDSARSSDPNALVRDLLEDAS